jgi:L-glutamine-phosphate cytidylyltransferase
MKAIILAAGMGTRLGKYTEGKPKALLEFAGKSLLEYQLDTLRAAGITDISIVKGYMAEKINFPDVVYYEDHSKTNMVTSLFCAREQMDDDFLLCYGDILYEPHVLEKVLNTDCDVGVTVDTDFLPYWNARLENPQEDHESLVMNEDEIIKLGAPNPPESDIHGRYVGLIKFAGNGVNALKQTYDDLHKKHWDSPEPWYFSKSFKKAYMTDVLQAMIDDGNEVAAIKIEHGWLEFDTTNDYEKYQEWLKTGAMNSFFHFS